MFGFGHGPELIIILVIALIVLGPGKIPEVAQMLGKGIRELRQASADLQKTFDVNELINPAPPAPPAPEPPPEPVSASETILPPADAPAKPKRTRTRPAATDEPSLAAGANGASAEASAGARRPRRRAAADAEPGANGIAEPAAKPAARRRPSKKTTEPVSLDAPA